MQLEQLALEGVGGFRERVELGPFDRGLNILAQPNEWGKTTVLRALARALFDKYSSQAREIEALRPSGSSLAPRVEVIFRADGARYRLTKRFLEGRACELFRAAGNDWERLAESDQADARVRQLLGAPALEGRVAKPETWGLLRYLWTGQDDPADWPDWDGATGEAARGRLVTVELDATVRALVEGLRAQAATVFTDTGRVKKDGPLAAAEARIQQLDGALSELSARRAALEETRARHEQLAREVASLAVEREQAASEAARLREEASGVEKIAEDLARHAADLERAREALEKVQRDEQALATVDQAIVETETHRVRQLATRERLAGELPGHVAALQKLDEQTRGLVQDRRERTERAERVRGLLRLRALAGQAKLLAVREAHVHEAAAELQRLQLEKSKLPAVTPALVKRAQELDRTAREARAKLTALGLRVTLTPAGSAQGTATRDGELCELTLPATLHANRTLTLELAGWGRVEIVSGSIESSTLAEELQRTDEALRKLLGDSGLATVAAAEAHLSRATELAQEIKAAEKTLHARLDTYDSPAACAAARVQADAALERQMNALAPTAEEAALSMAALESEEQQLKAAAKAEAGEEHRLAEATKAARAAGDAARRAHEDAERELTRLDEARKQLTEQKAMLAARHAGGMAAAKQTAQREFVAAEARRDEAQRRLPAGHEKLRARSLRAAAAAAEVEAQHTAKISELDRLRGALEAGGGEGLYSRANEIEEQLAIGRAEAARWREDGWAARLAAELIQRRQTAAIQTVLGPLEESLSAAFADLTGVRDRRVIFNAQLGLEGVGRTREDAVPFAALSRGAREQLLLALRAAIALTCAPDDPPCLILDDVLVHTDSGRQQNVLDYLQTLAQRVQIVILTCHAERYRGAGHVLAATRPAS